MRSRGAVLVAAACAFGSLAVAQAQRPAPVPAPPRAPAASAPAHAERPVPFKVGEVLSYDVGWSSYLTAGTATVEVRSKDPSFDSVAYHVVAEGRPTSFVAALYTLYYKVDTLLDAYTLLPQRASTYSEEGKRRRTASTRFDQAAHTARYEVRTRTVLTKDVAVPPNTQDALSAIFLIRTLPLRDKFSLTVPVVNGDDVYRVQVVVAGRENVTTPLGQFAAWKVTPVVTNAQGAPDARTFALWIADDAKRLPLKLEAEMPVGRFVLSLREARGKAE